MRETLIHFDILGQAETNSSGSKFLNALTFTIHWFFPVSDAAWLSKFRITWV